MWKSHGYIIAVLNISAVRKVLKKGQNYRKKLLTLEHYKNIFLKSENYNASWNNPLGQKKETITWIFEFVLSKVSVNAMENAYWNHFVPYIAIPWWGVDIDHCNNMLFLNCNVQ